MPFNSINIFQVVWHIDVKNVHIIGDFDEYSWDRKRKKMPFYYSIITEDQLLRYCK